MKKSLMYSLPVLVTAACTNYTADAPDLDTEAQSCLSQPQEEALQPYYQLLVQNPKITEVIGLCERHASFQAHLWNKIREAEKSGLPPTAPMPISFYEAYSTEQKKTRIAATKEEAEEIYAAHLAHAFWLERNEIVPWSLSKYTQKQLEDLLQPKAWFDIWDDENEEYSFHLILDYSPRETYAITKEMVPSLSDQRTALDEIIKATRSYKHGSTTYDTFEIVTMQTMAENKKSLYGCQSMVPFILQLANALNIPGKSVSDYFADSSEGHRSALFEFTDQVLAHGDDPYDSWLGNTPSSELMDSYSFWGEKVLAYKPGDEQSEHNSMVHYYENTMKYPSNRVLQEYCGTIIGDFGEGRNFLENVFLNNSKGSFASLEEVDDFEKKILDISQNCTIFPADNPDNQ